ncbi:LysE family translocator [Corynebacterium auriscanis]|uniref:LysE family translocator n=1 Tax=Corynebacterium auriscanis TaxID=99807 RepID=UPI003CF85845
MSIELLGTILVLNALGVFTPGPDLLLVLRMSAKSRPHALAAVAGIVTGATFWIALTIAGAAILLTRHPGLLTLIQLAGAAYLLYMAFGLARVAKQQWNQPVQDIDMAEILGTLSVSYRQGLMTNLSNPKIVLYLTAIIAPALPAGTPWYWSVILGALLVVEAALGFGFVAFVVSTARVRRKLLGAGPIIDAISATLFVIFATVLLARTFAG